MVKEALTPYYAGLHEKRRMDTNMQAVMLLSPRTLSYEEVPLPRPGAEEVAGEMGGAAG